MVVDEKIDESGAVLRRRTLYVNALPCGSIAFLHLNVRLGGLLTVELLDGTSNPNGLGATMPPSGDA